MTERLARAAWRTVYGFGIAMFVIGSLKYIPVISGIGGFMIWIGSFYAD